MRSPLASRPGGAAGLLAAMAVAFGLAACSSPGHGSGTGTTVPAASYKVLLDAGVHLLRQGNSNAAAQLFQQAIQRNPRGVVAYYDLGVVYQGEGQTSQALHQYQLASKADPRYVPALYNEAVIVAGSDPKQAMVIYQSIVRIQPNSPTAFLNLGLLEAAAHEQAQAVLDLREAVKLDGALASRVPASLRSQVAAP